MSIDVSLEDIRSALSEAKVDDFTGSFEPLGGGEVNNTYKLYCRGRQLILRIAKDEEQSTLLDEARSLKLLELKGVPKLVFFDEASRIQNRMWILEDYIAGTTADRLSVEQFSNLGKLLAQVHAVPAPADFKLSIWGQLLDNCESFGDEQYLLNHPDAMLRDIIRSAQNEYRDAQPEYGLIPAALIHSDATPSNILVNGSEVGLIDWEFSKFSDPMLEFSTIYYEDMEYNKGKWRIQINPEEKLSLFSGYEKAGGKIDEERIRFWIKFDKLGAAVFLYWRVNQSSRETSPEQAAQYKLDLENIKNSLSATRAT